MDSEQRLLLYHKLILDKIPYILSLQDREKYSLTFGCFDRTYWQWKFLDFPNARCQEVLLCLSYVYKTNFKDNHFFHNQPFLEWIEAGFLFYAKIQHKDGSFDEAYPYERSFVATGFSLFYLTEAFLLLQGYLKEKAKEKILTAFAKAGDWLIKNDESHAFISNHKLGACAGLFNLTRILKDKKYERRCWHLWQAVKDAQSLEGWFNEYGGADPGYLTQGIYYAAMLYQRSQKEEVLEALRDALDFIKYFVHPDATIGGEYGSRNTDFYFPGGFEILAKHSALAEAICRKFSFSIQNNSLPCVNSVDFYNMIPILNSIVNGNIFYVANNKADKLPYSDDKDFTKFFEDAQILVKKTDNLYVVVGISKGGVLKVYSLKENKLLKSCVGIFGKIKNKVVTSQFLYKKGDLKIKIEENIVVVEGNLSFAKNTLLSPLKMIILRSFSLSNRYLLNSSKFLKQQIVNLLILKNNFTKWKFKRVISLAPEDQIGVVTDVYGVSSEFFQEMTKHTSYHMGSSKYFNISELNEGD